MEPGKLTLLDLPLDYLAEVMLYFPVRSLLELRCVCSTFRALINHDHLWKYKYHLYFAKRRSPKIETRESWLAAFKQRLNDDFQNTKLKKSFMAAIEGDLEGLVKLDLNFDDLYKKSNDYKVLYKSATRDVLNPWS